MEDRRHVPGGDRWFSTHCVVFHSFFLCLLDFLHLTILPNPVGPFVSATRRTGLRARCVAPRFATVSVILAHTAVSTASSTFTIVVALLLPPLRFFDSLLLYLFDLLPLRLFNRSYFRATSSYFRMAALKFFRTPHLLNADLHRIEILVDRLSFGEQCIILRRCTVLVVEKWQALL